MRNKIKTLLMVFALTFGLSVGAVGCAGNCEHTYADEVIAPTCVEGGIPYTPARNAAILFRMRKRMLWVTIINRPSSRRLVRIRAIPCMRVRAATSRIGIMKSTN